MAQQRQPENGFNRFQAAFFVAPGLTLAAWHGGIALPNRAAHDWKAADTLSAISRQETPQRFQAAFAPRINSLNAQRGFTSNAPAAWAA
ncbi:hypothetical protein [Kingella oralis]